MPLFVAGPSGPNWWDAPVQPHINEGRSVLRRYNLPYKRSFVTVPSTTTGTTPRDADPARPACAAQPAAELRFKYTDRRGKHSRDPSPTVAASHRFPQNLEILLYPTIKLTVLKRSEYFITIQYIAALVHRRLLSEPPDNDDLKLHLRNSHYRFVPHTMVPGVVRDTSARLQ